MGGPGAWLTESALSLERHPELAKAMHHGATHPLGCSPPARGIDGARPVLYESSMAKHDDLGSMVIPAGWQSGRRVVRLICTLSAFAFVLSPMFANEIKNGDFTSGAGAWSQFMRGYAKPRPCKVVEDSPGNRALQLDLGPDFYRVTQEIQVPKKFSVCVLSFRAKLPPGSKSGSPLRVGVDGGEFMNQTSASEVPLAAGNDWQTHKVNLTADASTRKITLWFTVPRGAGSLLLDDVSLTDTTEAK